MHLFLSSLILFRPAVHFCTTYSIQKRDFLSHIPRRLVSVKECLSDNPSFRFFESDRVSFVVLSIFTFYCGTRLLYLPSVFLYCTLIVCFLSNFVSLSWKCLYRMDNFNTEKIMLEHGMQIFFTLILENKH